MRHGGEGLHPMPYKLCGDGSGGDPSTTATLEAVAQSPNHKHPVGTGVLV